VRLTERNISRRHARLTKPDDHWVLFDLSSYNGCYVNGQRVNGQHVDRARRFGAARDYRLQVIDDTIAEVAPFDKAVTMPAAPRSQALLGQPDRLVMVIGPERRGGVPAHPGPSARPRARRGMRRARQSPVGQSGARGNPTPRRRTLRDRRSGKRQRPCA